MNTKEKQTAIVDDFAMLDGDMEMMIGYLMELGEKLPAFPEAHRSEDNVVKGCQSTVWLFAELRDNKVMYFADSNTAITKGLVSLLVTILTNQTPDDILNTELFFHEKIGMNRFIGTQRSNGFNAMLKQMQLYALALKTKVTQ